MEQRKAAQHSAGWTEVTELPTRGVLHKRARWATAQSLRSILRHAGQVHAAAMMLLRRRSKRSTCCGLQRSQRKRALLWMRLSDFMPLKAGCIQSGRSAMARSFSSEAYGFCRRAGTWISSKPCALHKVNDKGLAS